MAGFTEFETSDRVLNTRMNAFGNELYSQITKYSTYDLYLKQGNLMNPQKPTGAGTEVIFANVTGVEKLAYTFNYAIPEDLIISKDNRYNLVIPFKQLDANRSFVFRFLYKHEGTTIFDITRNATTTATGNLTVEFQALNQNVSDIVALANTTVTLQIFLKTTSGTDAQISLLVNDVNALGRLSRNEATAIVSADNVLMPDGVTSVNSAIGQNATNLSGHISEIAGKHISESGFNANGWYIKFDDGTMICNGSINVTATANTDSSSTWVFPATFVGGRRVLCNIASISSTNQFALNKLVVGGFDGSNCTVTINATASQTYVCNAMAIGRWKA